MVILCGFVTEHFHITHILFDQLVSVKILTIGALDYSTFGWEPSEAALGTLVQGPWQQTNPSAVEKDWLQCVIWFHFFTKKEKLHPKTQQECTVVLHQSEGIVKSSARKEKHSGGFEATVLQNWAEIWRQCAALLHSSAMCLHQWDMVVCVCSLSQLLLPSLSLAQRICRHKYNPYTHYN